MHRTNSRTEPDAAAFAGFTRRWVRGFADSAMATEAELTALDQQVGDGDFGTNLVAGLRATLRRLDAPRPAPESAEATADRGADALSDAASSATVSAAPASTPAAGPGAEAAGPLRAAADAFLDEVGGTSGPLFGLLFQELAVTVRAKGAEAPTAALALGMSNGLAAIQRVGEAEVGDKTLVDALAPAVATLSASCSADPGRALAEAAEAAWQGVRATARGTARRGRASYLGDRAAGVPDPGAVGVALLLTAANTPATTLPPHLA
jgi:dihydroxyacetone kinase-like protein